MNNIRKSTGIIFKKQNPESIIQNYFKVKKGYKIGEDLFQRIFSYENPLVYNKDEINNVHDLLESNWKKLEYVNEKSEFNVLVNFTREVLIEEEGEPVCKFEKLLKWRELSYELGEDILTTSYFAYKDYIQNYNRTIFAWKPIVRTDNYKLRELLKKGTAENHFHLKGSSPHFQLTWISLMNNILGRDEEFAKLEKELCLLPELKHSFKEEILELKTLVKKASYIRYLLFSILNNIPLESDEKEKIDINILKSTNDKEVNFYLTELQSEINYIKYEYGKSFGGEIADYAIPKSVSDNNYNKKNKEYNGNILLYGERNLLYRTFKGIYSGNKDIIQYKDFFYAYLIIKEKLRNEIIQVNHRVGFANFGDYQNRKDYFLEGIYKEAVINMAINSSIHDQSIKSLEARIAPSDTASDMEKQINNIDKNVESKKFLDIKKCKVAEFEKKLKNDKKKDKEYDYFYTVHFIKIEETYRGAQNSIDKNKYIEYVNPLNYKVRKNVEKQAKAIINLRKRSSEEKKRLFGIDAANVEIGCRPEVFAQAFRYVRNYHSKNDFENFGIEENFNIGITYHAGEDFLDIVDGLRAIDETIRFLNYEQGDRLGHALALGIEPKAYFQSKNMRLVKNKQVHLDDVAWLLAKVREYNIENINQCEIAKLENDFHRLFHEIYDEGMDRKGNSCNHYDYYSAWKLRGDNPKYYFKGIYEEKSVVSFWERCGIDDSKKIELTSVRRNKLCCDIYRNYHYNPHVRLKGLESEVVKISGEYINIVEKLQKGLQREIARRNICIETNPTSNYVIGTFRRFANHPITNFFNLGLTANYEEIKNCPQISVSINTDDQGVFPTYLENEYALMALALEKEKDESGNPKYQPMMIYEWLDKVRQMGLEQSFMRRKIES